MRELSLHVMDIAQNSLAAGADTIEIDVIDNVTENLMEISISDNGSGMSADELKAAGDPFYSTKPGHMTGMGLPLFKMSAEQIGGSFEIISEKGAGTTVRARYNTTHIDMIPLGDINETISLLISCNPGVDFVYTRRGTCGSLTLDTIELKKAYSAEALTGSGAYPLVHNILSGVNKKGEY